MTLPQEIQERIENGLKLYDNQDISSDYTGTETVIILKHETGIKPQDIGSLDQLGAWLWSFEDSCVEKVEAVYTDINTYKVSRGLGFDLTSMQPIQISARDLEELLVVEGRIK